MSNLLTAFFNFFFGGGREKLNKIPPTFLQTTLLQMKKLGRPGAKLKMKNTIQQKKYFKFI